MGIEVFKKRIWSNTNIAEMQKWAENIKNVQEEHDHRKLAIVAAITMPARYREYTQKYERTARSYEGRKGNRDRETRRYTHGVLIFCILYSVFMS